jgi:succinate-semialdehyde dehydrogenase/glutarate-semialdehyde dehydrogenase
VSDHNHEQTVVDAVPRELLIGGEWRAATGGRTFVVEDPSTGAALTEVADGTPEDGLAALDAAVAAQDGWAATPPRVRGEILRRTYELLVERREDLALLMTLEMGKSLSDSRAEVSYAAEFFRWFSEEAVRIDGSYTISPAGGARLLTLRQPVGPCLLITPWNFPMAMGTRKLGPAIAAGCTMICKPAALTPLSMLALARLLEEAGLPPGVLNIVSTKTAGAVTGPVIADPRLRKLIKLAADNVLKVSMELGGNAPFVVFADADLDAAIDGAVIAKMRNIGEACTAANRFLVHASVADEFARRLADRLGAMKIGRGADETTEVGPLITGVERDKVAALVDGAIGNGAKALTGGGSLDGPGYFFAPTVLTGIDPGDRILREEIFGPVAPIVPFETDEEAVTAANDTEYGLVSYVFTRDLNRALRVVEGLDTGMVGLNQGLVSNPAAPFGGVKQSGLGREGGSIGIDEYLETKYVAVNLPG